MAATIRPNEINMATTPTLSNKTLPAPQSQQKAEKKITAPRIDLEPLYVAVKGAISDADWATYKSTISAFLLGQLNQEELSAQLDRILTTPALEHAHNQFIISIYANALREPPEPGTASWADDKVVGKVGGAGGKGSGSQGDEAEKRLKHEVMHIARRERKRLKTLHDEGWDPFYQEMVDMADAKKIHTPDTGSVSAGGYQKTNWDLEIRKRYTNPLFVETHEFPDPTSIGARMLPICYENGLPNGHDPECPTFMNIATETYIKEALSNFFQRVSSNGPGYIKTAEYKRKVAKEEDRVAAGEIGRTPGGLLPIEQEELRRRRPLCMEDLRMAMTLGDGYLGQTPIIWGSITNGHFLDTPGVEEIEDEERERLRNGDIATSNGNARPGRKAKADIEYYGYNVELGDPGVVMDDDWTWTGAGVQDVQNLDAVLDGCLAVGL